MRIASYLFMLLICTQAAQASELERARQLAREALIADTHIDVPYRLREGWADVSERVADRDFDYYRAREGGLDLAFMSIFVPASDEHAGRAYAVADQLIDSVEALVGRAPEKFAIVTSADQAHAIAAAGKVALALGMENGAPVAGDLEKLRHFHRRGIRYITLTHSMANHISDSSYDQIRLWQGLSPFGADLVAAMNDLGMIIDISHVSDAAFSEVIELSRAPLIASHSSARHFTPDFERNMSDDMIRALAAGGGVIMINFGSGFLTPGANAYSEAYRKASDAFAARHGLAWGDPALRAFEADYRAKQPFPFATVSDVADHVQHVVDLVGVDHVGLGSDFDGVGDSLPVGLKDVSQYPNLVAELLRRGYGDQDIRKILGGNTLRVWRDIERAAQRPRPQ